jgi:hypothetical protein
MSRWGEDNFDSDCASDYLTGILLKLEGSINECLSLSKDIDIFNFGEARLMPACELLVTLGKAYPQIVVPFLEDKPIADWRDKYLKVFDEKAGDVMDKDFKQERRKIIAATFSDLIGMYNSY